MELRYFGFWNLWLVCGKMINSSLESAVCKTPHIIKHSGRYSNFSSDRDINL